MYNQFSTPKFLMTAQLIESEASAVIFDEKSCEVTVFEELEWEICKMCDGIMSIEKICMELASRYEASVEEIKSDVIVFLQQLEKEGFIEPNQEMNP